MKIGFISADWGQHPDGTWIPGGAGWVRIHQPATALANHGHTVRVGAHAAVGKDGRIVPLNHEGKIMLLNPDVIVLQRWMHRDAADAIRRARGAGQAIVNDVDDWFWGLHPANRAYWTTSPRHDREQNRDHYAKALTASTVVTVSTPFLAKRLKERFGADTRVIRNAVDYPSFAVEPVRKITTGIRVGWCGALQYRSQDLETLRGVLPAYLERVKGTFVHHGTWDSDMDTAADRIGLAPHQVGPSRPGLPPQLYPDNVAGFDIGIVPLSDTPFNHAKSTIKGLEYAAAGIPFVAQATDEYVQLGCGLTAATPREWGEALDRLTDPVERGHQQRLGLSVAHANGFDTRWADWETVLHDALTREAQPVGA